MGMTGVDVLSVFFFKQKTAYEMRISDWSSDVCPSDLSIRTKYGDEALSRMDKAYEAGKHDQWIRFRFYNGQMDMPLARHMIIAQHLFGSSDDFESALQKELILQHAAGAKLRLKLEKHQLGRKAQQDRTSTRLNSSH